MVPDPVGSAVFVLQKLFVTPISAPSFCSRRLLGALPEFFRGWAESAFCPDDAHRDRFRLRSDVQKFDAVSETVTKVRTNGDAGSRFDGRNNTKKTVVLLHHPRFLFQLRKDYREKVIVIRIIFAGEANQRFGRNLGNRNGAASGERLLRGDRHTNAFVKQFLISHVLQRASLRGRNDQSKLKPAIAYPIENGVVAPIVQS